MNELNRQDEGNERNEATGVDGAADGVERSAGGSAGENREPSSAEAGGSSSPGGEEIARQLGAAREELEKSRKLISQLQVEREMSRAAYAAGAIDLEAVCALAEKQMTQDGALTPGSAVERLRQAKPMLFRSGYRWGEAGSSGKGGSGRLAASGVMGSRVESGGESRLEAAASRAEQTGEIGALMNYLRLRRAAV